MKDFRNLKVWQKSHLLVLEIYKQTKLFPKEEIYGITSQIRRAAISITSNIAEGCGRGSDAEFARFSQIVLGSACEVEYQLLLSHDLGYLQTLIYDKINKDLIEIKKMLTSLIKKLKANS
jgi:four helix bundle protein